MTKWLLLTSWLLAGVAFLFVRVVLGFATPDVYSFKLMAATNAVVLFGLTLQILGSVVMLQYIPQLWREARTWPAWIFCFSILMIGYWLSIFPATFAITTFDNGLISG